MGAIQLPRRFGKAAGIEFPPGMPPALHDEPMHFEPGIPRHIFRTVWISDTHLGTPGCKADLLLDFLKSIECETIYLVGDIVDGWQLKKGWYWLSRQLYRPLSRRTGQRRAANRASVRQSRLARLDELQSHAVAFTDRQIFFAILVAESHSG